MSGVAASASASAPAGEATAAADKRTQSSTSRGFANWLTARNASLAFTSYQTGQLFLVGVMANNRVSFHQSHFPRAMGLHVDGGRIYLVSNVNVWRLENVLGPNQRANQHFDTFYMPRNAQYTGDLDGHEIALDASRRIVFVNTKFSCLAVPTRGLLLPSEFIGIAERTGAIARIGVAMLRRACRDVSGWRDRRWEGGVIIDVQSNEVIVDDLSMPHSPRVHEGALWVLDSGRGYLVKIDIATKARTDIAFCPGFLRGLAFAGRFAIVTTSLPRDGAF